MSDKSGPAEWIAVIISALALLGVTVEYFRARSREKLELAQNMIEKLSTDEMLSLACTILDWGTAIVVVPEPWRDVVQQPFIKWNLDDVREAAKAEITSITVGSPVRLMYRHAFVRLFDHLERVGDLVEKRAIALRLGRWWRKSGQLYEHVPRSGGHGSGG